MKQTLISGSGNNERDIIKKGGWSDEGIFNKWKLD